MILRLYEHRYTNEAVSAVLDPSPAPLAKEKGTLPNPDIPPSSSSLLGHNRELVRRRGGVAVTGPFPSVMTKVNPAPFAILTMPHAGATVAPPPLAQVSLAHACARTQAHTSHSLIGHHWVSWSEAGGRGFASFLYLALLPSLLPPFHHPSPWPQHTSIPRPATARALPQLRPPVARPRHGTLPADTLPSLLGVTWNRAWFPPAPLQLRLLIGYQVHRERPHWLPRLSFPCLAPAFKGKHVTQGRERTTAWGLGSGVLGLRWCRATSAAPPPPPGRQSVAAAAPGRASQPTRALCACALGPSRALRAVGEATSQWAGWEAGRVGWGE